MMNWTDLDALEPAETLTDPREEWMRRRRGKITGSNFSKLIGKGRSKSAIFTQAGLTYLRTVAAERLGSWAFEASARSLEWGNRWEPIGLEEYANRYGQRLESGQFSFCEFNDWVGSTPDGLVGHDGCVELKCPVTPTVHMNTLITGEIPAEYLWQCHGHLLCTGRNWCDFVSYDPRMDSQFQMIRIRLNRDGNSMTQLRDRLQLAAQTVSEMVKTAKQTLKRPDN